MLVFGLTAWLKLETIVCLLWLSLPTDENLLFETDLSGRPSLCGMFSLLLKELIFTFYYKYILLMMRLSINLEMISYIDQALPVPSI